MDICFSPFDYPFNIETAASQLIVEHIDRYTLSSLTSQLFLETITCVISTYYIELEKNIGFSSLDASMQAFESRFTTLTSFTKSR